jgi:hypothetical protein
MTLFFYRLSTVLLLSLMVTSAPVSAGPSTETPAVQTPRTVGTTAAPASPRSQGKATDSDSRTIDLLLQVQQPTAGLQFNERKGASESGETRVRSAPATSAPPQNDLRPSRAEAPPPTPASSLFGAGATPQVQSNRQMPSPAVSSGGSTPPRRASTEPSAGELARLLLLPREVIDYLRENRGFVLSCVVGVLVLGWSASLLFSRRRS